MNSELLEVVKERGLLLEKEVFELMNHLAGAGIIRSLLENIEQRSGQKIITRSLLNQHFSSVQEIVRKLSGERQQEMEHIFVKLGLSVEIKRSGIEGNADRQVENSGLKIKKESRGGYQLFYAGTRPDKKLEVGDFVGHFRARYQQLQRILMQRPELHTNLVSIGKLGGDRQQINIIAMVKEKRISKNGNLIVTFEDLTGQVSGIVKADNKELYDSADELQLDDIVGVKASGNRDLLFVHNIIFPDSFLQEKIKFDEDVSAAFISDLHCGSDRHLKSCFERFLEWLNNDENAKKIKYLFITGDCVDGVGIFPNQEKVLNLKSMKEQYELFASYLKKIPKNITIFVAPGQHDACRLAEPQPLISRKYAPEIYEMENVVLVTNPCFVKLIEGLKEFKVLMYHGASIHAFINEIKELRLIKAHRCPAKAVKHMLKRRHLSPTHGSATGIYIPYIDNDPLVISEVPDVLCTGEVHRLDIENYHGTLIITGSCWQAQTPFMEKVGNEPDPSKVPVLNLKTRELKIFDFSDKKEEESGK